MVYVHVAFTRFVISFSMFPNIKACTLFVLLNHTWQVLKNYIMHTISSSKLNRPSLCFFTSMLLCLFVFFFVEFSQLFRVIKSIGHLMNDRRWKTHELVKCVKKMKANPIHPTPTIRHRRSLRRKRSQIISLKMLACARKSFFFASCSERKLCTKRFVFSKSTTCAFRLFSLLSFFFSMQSRPARGRW